MLTHNRANNCDFNTPTHFSVTNIVPMVFREVKK